jgi:predicted transcriptional regulator
MLEQENEKNSDSVLRMVENSIRRSIIKRLSQEPSYALQLSKELGLGQQLIAKHLDALEETGLVISSMEESPTGPKRKSYALNKSVSVTLDFAPNLYSFHVISLDSNPQYEMTKEASALANRIDRIIRSADDRNKINSIGKVLSDIDKRLGDLQDERAGLLYIRNFAMSEAAKVMKKSDQSTDSRRVVYHILDSHNKNVPDISESVNLREEIVRKLLGDLEKDLGVL